MGKKVLLIEDESDQVTMIQARLESEGMEFNFALNGELGLKKVKEGKPDLILLDIIMPKMDGFEVLKILKADPDTRNIPVIVISAAGMEHLEEKCIKLGANELIKKPYESGDLLDKVKKYIS